MEQDKELKNLLTKGAIEEASSVFTNDVMRRIEATNIHKPALISPVLKRVFIYSFVAVLAVLLTITFALKPGNFPLLQYIKMPEITLAFFNKTLLYVSLFWLLILINYLTEKFEISRSHHNNFQQ